MSAAADVRSVVFIDSRVPDLQDLLNGLAPGEVAFVLDPSRDGIEQIAGTLAANGLSGLSAISIVGHGSAGALDLGSTMLDDAALQQHAALLATIGAALVPGGDLQLYACNVASGAGGQQFIADLAHLTGADVAAATHLVGSADHGGNWSLDAATGAIEAGTPFTADALMHFHGDLADDPPVVTASAGATSADEQVATVVDSGITVSDADNGTLASAKVSVTGNFQSGEDVLAFVNDGATMGDISATYDSSSGILSLTSASGTATVAQWQNALAAVTYEDTSDAPDTADRTISFAVNDGTLDSVAATKTVSVAAINDAPVLTPAAPELFVGVDDTGNLGETVAALLATTGTDSVSDPDGAVPQGIAITGETESAGTWQYSTDSGGTWTDVPTNVGDTAALVLADTDLVRFIPDGSGTTATETLTYRAWDQTDASTHGTQVNIAATGGATAFSDAVDTATLTVTNPTTLEFLQSAALTGGGFVVTYSKVVDTNGTPNENVYAEMFTAQGQPLGGTFQVSADNTIDDFAPRLTALSNGDFAITWQHDSDIFTRVYDGSGTEVTSGVQTVAAGAPDANGLDSVIALGNGDYAVLYDRTDGGTDDNVYTRIFHSDGTAPSSEIAVNNALNGLSDTTNIGFGNADIQDTAHMVKLDHGYAVMWDSVRDDGGGDVGSNVLVRVIGNDGSYLTPEMQANGPDGASEDFSNEITALGGDSFAVEWVNEDTAESVFTRNFTLNSGSYVGAPVETAPGTATRDALPAHLTTLSDGSYVALWNTLSAFSGHVFVQTYLPDGSIAAGSLLGGVQVDAVSGVLNTAEQVLALDQGFAVMWTEFSPLRTDTYVRIFDATSAPTSAPILVDLPDDCNQVGVQMVKLADGSFEVFWTRTDDTANGSLDTVLYRHFGADGTLLSDPIELAHTPSDLSVSSDFSEIAEIRAALNGNSLLGIAEIVGDEINSNPESFTVDTQFTLPPPQISNPDTVVAAAGTGAVDLRIAAPTESDGTTPTVTIDTVPSYGTVQYFDGAQFVDVTANMSLTPAQLATLRYVPPASGEHGGESLTYTASDGTAAVHGTVDISVVVDSTVAAKLFFSAFGGPGNGGPPDLFTLDSSGQPVALALNAANGSFAGTDGGFFQFAGNLYFMASTPASGNAVVLQKMTPNGTVTAVGDGSGGFFGDPGDDVHFTEFAGSLYLRAIGPDGDQLVRIAANGVAHSIVLNPGFEAFAGANGGFTELDGSLYFSAVTPASSFGNPDLIRLDADGTITDISAVNSDFSSAGEDGGFVAFNHALYFNAFSFASSFGDTLIRLDAGSTEPVPVDASDQQLGHLFTGVSSGFHVFDGNLYFNETTFSALDALVKMDASGNLTEIDYNGDALFGAGAMNGWADMGGSAYFVATTAATGADLFKLDADGTVTAIDVNPGSGDAFDANLLSGFTLFDGSLYFDAYDGNGTGDGLFKLDRDGTLTEIDLGNSPGATTLASVNGGFKQFGGSLYFSAFAQSNGEELIKLDADGTVHVIDVNPGADNAFDPQTPATNNDFAVFPLTVLTGTSGRDILVGGVGGEALDGGAGDDVLEGRNGKDLLTGGDGADVFKFSAIGAANIDTVTDYTLAAGDTLDLADLLDATFPSGGTASDFVRLIASGKDLLLQVDPTGNRSHHWKDVAILQGANTAANDQALTSFGGANHLITESPANTAPVAANDTGAVVEYRTVGGNVIAGASGGGGQDYDPESDPLTVTAITGAHGAGTIGAPLLGAHGTLTLQANGAYRYVADHAEPLAVATVVFDSFTYTLSDGKGGTDTATLTVDIFGASTGTPAPDHLIGSPENDTLDGLGSADLMEGKGGDDLYYVDNAGDKVIEAANAGTDRVLASVSYVLGIGQSIEALTPTDYNSTTNINLTGNALLQTIIGNAGNNVLNDGGAGGGDTMQGLGGDDAYVVNNATDRIIEGAGQGNDQVLASISFVLPIGQSIETLTPTSFTGTTAIDLTGNTLSQRIFGNAGDNVLNDGGAGGADTLAGLGGDDLYYVYNSSDIVIESAGAGTDRVLTNVSFTLGGGQSIESLTPVDYSSTNAINLTGNTLSQSIVGNAGNNVISDGGIGGADTLVGLGGNDTYLVNNASDVVVENTNEGTDRVLASVSYTLGAGQSIESLTPNDYGGTAALHLTGNALSQTIVGNAGDNVLDDGGAGAPDTLQGLGGDDTYIINNSNDIVTEATGGGNDHVLTSVSFTLGAGQEIETLTPMNFGTSTTPINLTGNALSQTIIGNAGANVLNDGGAGQGDTMQGLGGDDTYIVNNASDIVTEGINGGNDHVLTSVSFTLGAGSEIESLTPTSFASTTGLTLTGNAFAQSITGNAGANVINGGAGNDTLQGLGGNDTFYFNSALNASTNVDSILDFTHGTDKIELDHAIFTALSPANPLPAADFTTGAPTTPDQHIIYNAATGALSYDDDGSGAHAAVQLATLTTHPALTSTDIFVV